MAKRLTHRQRMVLNCVVRYLDRHGYPPSIREIGADMGIGSLRGVTIHLDALERKGYIRRESTSRSITVLRRSDETPDDVYTNLPILGTIAAGEPLLAVQNIEGELPVPKGMLTGVDRAFLLRVRGDSMIGVHIMPDDMVVIRPQQAAENGDLVAVLIGEEATVKRLRSDNGELTLLPANPRYKPIPIDGRDAHIIGKVIGLLRSY